MRIDECPVCSDRFVAVILSHLLRLGKYSIKYTLQKLSLSGETRNVCQLECCVRTCVILWVILLGEARGPIFV